MKKVLLIILIIIITFDFSFSLDTLSTKYYPLKVGNSWTFHHVSTFIPPQNFRYKVTIVNSFVSNGHLYYTVGSDSYRVDSVYGRLLLSTSSGCNWLINEMLVDSLSAHKNDTFKGECNEYYYTHCTDTSSMNIFGITKPTKSFDHFHFEMGTFNKYAKDLGPVYTSFSAMSGYLYNELVGCVINGIVYGDTTITGLDPISGTVPSDFSLSQNYPNPFNPKTIINFELSMLSNVKLTVFDVLGREVAALVNKQLKPGTYEAQFDGTNYPSGVYFYKLLSEYYSGTKTMVLIK